MNTRRGRTRRGRARGFTLIEVLVVIAILAITVGLVTVSFTHDLRVKLEDEAHRLALLLQHARDEAIVNGQPVSLTAGAEGYRVSRRDPVSGARAVLDNGSREAQRVSSRFVLRIAGAPVPPGESLVFGASGVGLPYEIVLGADEWTVTLAGDHAGNVSVSRASKVAGGE